MENFEGKHFSITDPQNVRTVVYEVSKTEKEFEKNSPKFTIQRLDRICWRKNQKNFLHR